MAAIGSSRVGSVNYNRSGRAGDSWISCPAGERSPDKDHDCLKMSGDNEETLTAEETPVEEKEVEEKMISPEKAEEAKLKARYPNLGNKPGGSDLLRKRLQKGQKYFDSGDYNMAKAKIKNKQLPTAAPEKTEITGDHIPTPQDLPQRKPSLVASKLAG